MLQDIESPPQGWDIEALSCTTFTMANPRDESMFKGEKQALGIREVDLREAGNMDRNMDDAVRAKASYFSIAAFLLLK